MTTPAVTIKIMQSRVVSATEFKAKCLAILDEVHQRGESITITKRGQPVAVLAPPPRRPRKSSMNSLAGKVKIVGDIVNFNMDWDVLREAEE
jgi:prevent-host-death family protein